MEPTRKPLFIPPVFLDDDSAARAPASSAMPFPDMPPPFLPPGRTPAPVTRDKGPPATNFASDPTDSSTEGTAPTPAATPWTPIPCTKCGKLLQADDHCGMHQGKLYCSDDLKRYCYEHYFEARGYMCGRCKGLIVGHYMSALGEHWHLEHFECSDCKVNLGKKPYLVKEGKVFCNNCHIGRFGNAGFSTFI